MITRTASVRVSGATRKEEILHAARKLISNAGVKATSMRDLAREVGFTEGALYRHFKSKDEIVSELFSTEASRLHGWLSRSVQGGAPCWEQLDALVDGFVDYGFEQADSFRLIMELHDFVPASIRPGTRMPKELFLQVLEAVGREERWQIEKPVLVVFMVVGMLSRLVSGVRASSSRNGPASIRPLARAGARALVRAAAELAEDRSAAAR